MRPTTLLLLLILATNATAQSAITFSLMPQDAVEPKVFRLVEIKRGAQKQLELIKAKPAVKAAAIVAPPSPKRVIVMWDGPYPKYEVWNSFDLRSWQLLAVVTENQFTKLVDRPQEYFKVRGVTAEGLFSEWATK